MPHAGRPAQYFAGFGDLKTLGDGFAGLLLRQFTKLKMKYKKPKTHT